MGYLFIDRHTDSIIRQLSTDLAGDVMLIATLLKDQSDVAKVETYAKDFLDLDFKFHPHQKIDTANGYSYSEWLVGFIKETFEEKVSFPYQVSMDKAQIHIQLQLNNGVLEVDLSKRRLYSKTTPLVIIWTTISAVLLFGVALIFMRNQIKPLKFLSEAVYRFGKGEDPGNIPIRGATEIRKAALAFNVMRERLKRYMKERLEMLACVSHDLRTPLTRMKLQLALLPKTPERERLEANVNDMKNMVDEFLQFSTVIEEEPSKSVDMTAFLYDVLLPYREGPLKVSISKHELIKALITVKPLLLKRCMDNILSNAQKFATRVNIDLKTTLYGLEITFDDDGPGIPQDHLDEVFKPFFRLDASRNLDKGGVGLGLTIAKDAILAHGGAIRLDRSPFGGLRVVVRLPY